jgi:hypothetical protein
MNGWTMCSKIISDWTLYWNKWMFNMLKVGYKEGYNKDDKNKQTSICHI